MKLSVSGNPRRVVLEVPIKLVPKVNSVMRKHLFGGSIVRPVVGEKTATFSVSTKHIRLMVDAFAQAEYSPSIQRWLARQTTALQLPTTDENIEQMVVPGLVGIELRLFQKQGIILAASQDSFMIHDDLGLGKTIEALCAVALREAYPCLVVCPNTVKTVWARDHVRRFFPKLRVREVGGTADQRREQINSGADVLVINYEALRLHPELAWHPWQSVVLDESHRSKSAGAKLTQALHKIQAPYKLLLSGTPILNGRLEELWAPLHYAFPEEFPGDMSAAQPDWIFRRRYCIVVRGQIVAYRNVHRLRKKVHAHSIRRRKEDVLDELPKKIYSVRHIELTAEQRKLYRSIRDDMLMWLEDGTKKKIFDLRAKVTRLKQACFSPELYGGSKTSAKITELKIIVDELVRSGHKAIIMSQWAQASRIIARELSDYSMSYVDGKVPQNKRQREIDRFQQDPKTLLYIGTIKANMVGITLTAADYVILSDLDWVPANNEQAAGRAHRIGQTKVVNVVELQAINTIEERIAQLLEDKQAMNDLITERGPVPRLLKKHIQSIAEII